MEEIDIIELLKRIKEGKAPKLIEIDGTEYEFYENYNDIVCAYQTEDCDDWLENETITLDTKIKILDKPIIEELDPNKCYFKDGTEFIYKEMYSKINEIIRNINKGK